MAIDVEHVGRIDSRIDLRGGQAGVSEQLLKRPEVGPSREEMRCEAVAQGVRRKRVGKPQAAPSGCDCASHEVGVERASPRPDEQRHRST